MFRGYVSKFVISNKDILLTFLFVKVNIRAFYYVEVFNIISYRGDILVYKTIYFTIINLLYFIYRMNQYLY